MAATATRRPPAASPKGAAEGEVPRGAAGLGAALAVAALYAAFASGAIEVSEQSRFQVIVAAIAFGTLAMALFGRGVRFHPSRGALAGVGLLGGFAAWCALSITWSIAPDQSWLEANRALAYALVAGLGIALGSSLPRAAERVAIGYLAIATVIALYALGGKLFPWFEIPGLIDLDHAGQFSRLRAPLDYWNALALVCVLAIPLGVRAGTDLGIPPRSRMAALLTLVPLMTTLALTYSRGGLLVLGAALALLIGIGPERLRLAAAAAVGIAGTIPPVALAVVRDDLTTDGLSVSARSDDGVLFLLALVAGLAIAFVLARLFVRAGERVVMSPNAARGARRAAVVLAGVAAVVLLAGLALSDRGLTGTVSHNFDDFTEAKFDRQNDPARVLRTNSGNRWVWWEEATGGFADRPLIGHGAGSFPLTHLAYREEAIPVRNAHSVPLEFLSETGLIGFALALGGLGMLAAAAVRTTRARAPARERGFAVALLAAVFAASLHMWIDWDWEIPGAVVPVLAFLGVLAARPVETGARRSPPAGRGLALFAGGVAAAAVIGLAVLPVMAEDLSDEALTQAAKGTPEDLREANEKAARAKRLNPLAVQPLFVQASILERGNRPAEALGVLVEAAERQPDNPVVWSRLARFQVLIDDSAAALRSLSTLTSLDPSTLGYRALSGYILYDERRSASATGTPLPEKIARRRRPRPAPAAPADPADPDPPADTTPTPTPAPDVTPTPPAPRPAPAPRRAPPRQPSGGDPFRLEG